MNAMVKFEAEGSRQEALVESDGEKMFVRDLLRDQLRQKPPASVDELLARCVCIRREGTDAQPHNQTFVNKREGLHRLSSRRVLQNVLRNTVRNL